MEVLLNRADVRYASRSTSAGVLVNSSTITSIHPISGRTIPTHKSNKEGEEEDYIPLISLALGPLEGGALKTAFDEVASSRMYRNTPRSTLCTRFLDGLLDLWTRILVVSITPEGDEMAAGTLF